MFGPLGGGRQYSYEYEYRTVYYRICSRGLLSDAHTQTDTQRPREQTLLAIDGLLYCEQKNLSRLLTA